MSAEIRQVPKSKHPRFDYFIEIDGTPDEIDAAKAKLVHEYMGYGISIDWPAAPNRREPIELGDGRWRAFGSRYRSCD